MTFDPLVPRPIDRPTPIDGELDSAKIIAAPDDPADWPAWRDALARWRDEARAGYDGSAYERLEWTQSCFSVALVWLWDERLYDHEAQRFTPERLLAEAAAEFGGYDAVVLWHAYPVIGIDERNQFDWYRDVPGIRELVATFQQRDVRVFVDYNPWDVGTRREPVGDAAAVAELVRELGADGVFLDTMKEAMPELRAALPDAAFEGESTLPLARIADHHLSWAQWFADSARARRDPRALVRAAAHAPPHAPLEPQPRRGAAQRVAERRRRARLGERLRRRGSAGTSATAGCCAGWSTCSAAGRTC